MASNSLIQVALDHDGDAASIERQPTDILRPDQMLQNILDAVSPTEEIQDASWRPAEIASCLVGFLKGRHENQSTDLRDLDKPSNEGITKLVMLAVTEFFAIESSTQKREGRRALEEAAGQLLAASTCEKSSLIATLLVALTLACDHEASAPGSPCRPVASAICAVLTKQVKERENTDLGIVHSLFKALFREALPNNDSNPLARPIPIDWHIVSGLAKAAQVNCLSDDDLARDVSKVIAQSIDLDAFDADDASTDPADQVPKTEVAACLALASQFCPWAAMKADALVNVAISYDLWHAAERICLSTTLDSKSSDPNTATEALLEGAFQAKLYRQADTFATEFFDQGGKHRYLEARYLHACGTIAKVIQKGVIPVIDKQVDRVDKAAKKMESVDVETTFSVTPSNAADQIRSFTLQQLEETLNLDAAHRLATLWGMDYVYDEEAMLASEKKRREKYLQWEDVLPGSPPDLISTPDGLLTGVQNLMGTSNGDSSKLFGFDAEWGEDDKGVDLLQVSNLTSVVLIDIPALSSTPEGVDALAKTVGHLFASAEYTKVGFACRQDMSKLRGSSAGKRNDGNKKRWFGATEGIVDLNTFLATSDRSQRRMGLARVCERYLGKPLDKSEQCSSWNARPLSLRQRTYAALDAWTVVSIYNKLQHG